MLLRGGQKPVGAELHFGSYPGDTIMGRSQRLGTRLAPPLQPLAHSDVLNSTRRFAARVLLRIFVLMQHACIERCAVSTRDLQNNTHARLVCVLFQHWHFCSVQIHPLLGLPFHNLFSDAFLLHKKFTCKWWTTRPDAVSYTHIHMAGTKQLHVATKSTQNEL